MIKQVRINDIMKISSERREMARGYYFAQVGTQRNKEKEIPEEKSYPIYAVNLTIPIVRFDGYTGSLFNKIKMQKPNNIDTVLKQSESMGMFEHTGRYIAHVRNDLDHTKIKVFDLEEVMSSRLSVSTWNMSFFGKETLHSFTTERGEVLEIELPNYTVMRVDKEIERNRRLEDLGIYK